MTNNVATVIYVVFFSLPLATQLRRKYSSLSRNYILVSSYIIALPLKLGMACLFLIFPESSTWNSECFFLDRPFDCCEATIDIIT